MREEALFCQRALRQRALHGPGVQQLHADLRVDADQVAAPPAIDRDARQPRMVSSMYTGMARRVPNGEVPPTR
jgi:hypothetical protein